MGDVDFLGLYPLGGRHRLSERDVIHLGCTHWVGDTDVPGMYPLDERHNFFGGHDMHLGFSPYG